MDTNRGWILVITLAVCILLGLAGALMFPLNQESILVILGYESLLILGTIGIIRLIQQKALEDW